MIIGENTLVKRCEGLQGQISQKTILWLKTSGYNKYKINSGVLDKLSIEKIYEETLMG
jgi:rhamnose utilization protein RhaD (predicted bifunctional aldolase and dehydrogenase)